MSQEKLKESGVTATTPSGIVVYFQDEPKRLYRICGMGEDWVEVPSVTTVLDVLDSGPGLKWWAYRIGLRAAIALFEKNYLTLGTGHVLAARAGWTDDPEEFSYWQNSSDEMEQRPGGKVPLLEKLATNQKITPNHFRDSAGTRGVTVHSALEKWIDDRTLPVLEFYPEHEQGYVAGLLAFLTDLGEVTKTNTEVMVGSLEHEFAGRYDLEAQLKKASLVVNAKTGERVDIPAGLWLLDAKTSSAIYTSQYVQLEAYEGARVECGYKPTKGRMIVRFTADGLYEVGVSKLSFDVFLAVLSCYNALQFAEGAQKK